MIALSRLTKTFGRFRTRKVVLDDVSAEFEPGVGYVILGARGSGRTTLLRVLCGISRPTKGRVERRGTVSVPAGFGSSLAPYKTLRELSAFLSVLYDADPDPVLRSTAAFAEIDFDALDVPVATLAPITRARVNYALSYALPADTYLFDGPVGYGQDEFLDRCRQAFALRRRTAGTIVATHDVRGAEALGERGGVLVDGRLHLFDSVREAVQLHLELQLGGSGGMLAYADRLIRGGERAAAEEFLGEVVEAGSAPIEAYDLLADMRFADGRFHEAATVARAAIDRGSAGAKPRMLLARAAEAEGRLREAAVFADAALDADPGSSEARVFLARTYEKLNEPGQAGRLWRDVATRDGNKTALRLSLMNFVRASDWQGVLDMANASVAIDGDDVVLHELRVRALMELHRWDEARSAVSDLAKIDRPRALGLIYRLVKSPDWEEILAFLRVLDPVDLQAERGSNTMTHLRLFLHRKSIAIERDGQPEHAAEIRDVVSLMTPPDAPAAANPTVDA